MGILSGLKNSVIPGLIRRAPGIDIKDASGRTALHMAADMGEFDVVKQLIGLGAKTDLLDEEGSSVLHYAVKEGYTDMVGCLLKHADPNLIHTKNLEGKLPLQCVCAASHNDFDPIASLDIATLLIKAGSDVNSIDRKGYTVLHRVAQAGRSGLAQLLLDKGADIKQTNAVYGGNTPFHLAAMNNPQYPQQGVGQAEIMKLLMEKFPANTQDVNEMEQIPLAIATETEHMRVSHLLSNALVDDAQAVEQPQVALSQTEKGTRARQQYMAELKDLNEGGRSMPALHELVIGDNFQSMLTVRVGIQWPLVGLKVAWDHINTVFTVKLLGTGLSVGQGIFKIGLLGCYIGYDRKSGFRAGFEPPLLGHTDRGNQLRLPASTHTPVSIVQPQVPQPVQEVKTDQKITVGGGLRRRAGH